LAALVMTMIVPQTSRNLGTDTPVSGLVFETR